jgi:hypothetical protein
MADLNFPQNPNPGDTWSIGTRTWVWNGSGWQLQSNVTSLNPFTAVTAVITSGTNSTSTNTGALQVSGGVGIGRDLWVGGVIHGTVSGSITTATNIAGGSNNRLVYQTAAGATGFVATPTISSSVLTYNGSSIVWTSAVTTLTAGTDTAISTSTGNITVWNNSTLQSVTDRGASTTNAISITNTGATALSVSGSILVNGGTLDTTAATFNLANINATTLNIGGAATKINLGSRSGAKLSIGAVVNAGWASASDVVQLGTGAAVYSTGPTTLGQLQNLYYDGTDYRYLANGSASLSLQNSGNFNWFAAGAGTTGQVASLNQLGEWFNSGGLYIGINPTDPGVNNLTAEGTVRAADLYSNGYKVVTSVTPTAGSGISISSLISTGTNISFVISSTGVTSVIGTTYIGVSTASGSVVLTNLGVQTLTAGTDTAVSASTGTITVWNTSTLQSVTARGNNTDQQIVITNGTNSTSTNSGALQVSGGVGIGRDLVVGGTTYVRGDLYVNGTQTIINTNQIQTGDKTLGLASSASSALIAIDSGLIIGSGTGYISWLFDGVSNWHTSGGLTIDSTSSFTSAINASNTQTGALVVKGGVGIGSDLYVGGVVRAAQLYDNSRRVLTSVTPTAGTAISITSVSTSDTNTAFTINNTGVTSLAGTTYLAVSASTGAVTLTNLGVQTLTAGTDTAVSASTGTVTVWNNSTLQTVTDRGSATSNSVRITNTDLSTSPTTGQALLVTGGIGAQEVHAVALYESNTRVLTQVKPNAGTAISITSITTSNGTVSFTVNNAGVTSAAGTTYLGVSTATGAVIFTNLGVQSLTGSTYLGASSSTGTITLTNLGVQSLTGSTYLGASSSTGTITLTNLGVQALSGTPALGVSSSTGTVTITNLGVTAANGTTYLGVNASTGSVTFTNLGVQSLTGTQNLGVSASTGTVTLTNLGVTATIGTTYLGVSTSTGSVIFTNLGVQTLTAGTDTAVSHSTGTVTVWNTSTLQTVTNRGNTTTNSIKIFNATPSYSSTSGALVVDGGVGIGGDLYIGGTLYSGGSPVLTTSTFGAVFNSGTDITVVSDTATSALVINNISTLQSVTLRGATTTNVISFLNGTESTSTTTGAVVINGGLGLSGNLHVGGEIVATKLTIQYTTVTTTLVETDDVIKTFNETNAISTDTGALVVSGGAGFGKDVWIGGALYVNGSQAISSVVTNISGTTYIGVSSGSGVVTITNLGVQSLTGTASLGVSSSTGTITLTNLGVTAANGTTYLGVNASTGSVTFTNLGVQTIAAGTDTAVSASTGTVTVWNQSTLQSVTGRGATTPNAITISNGTAATDTASGALIVAGGIGAGGDLWANNIHTLDSKIALGGSAGSISQGANAVAIGYQAGEDVQGAGAVAIGYQAGSLNQGANAVAIGKGAGSTSQASGSIIINASGSEFDGALAGFYVNPVRNDLSNTAQVIYFNTVTNEITYAPNTLSTSTLANFAVTSISGTTYIGVSTSTGAVTITNLGVQSLTGTASLGVSSSTGTITLTNLGVTAANGTTYLGVNASTGSVTFTNLGVQTIAAGTDTAVSASTGTVTVWNTSTLATVTARGATTPNAITISNTSASSNTSTGALIIAGGMGVGGTIYTTDLYVNGYRVSTSTFAQTVITAGTDTAVSTSTGNITVWNTSTLATVTARGATTPNAVTITNTTQANATNSGALQVGGGVGIGGNLYVGGEIVAEKLTIQYTTVTTTLIQTDDVIKTSNTTNSTGTNSGALIVAGGAGFGGDVYAKTLYSNGFQVSTATALTVQYFGGALGTVNTLNFATGTTATIAGSVVTIQATGSGSSTGTTSTFLIANNTSATSTNSGALQVYGGAGIGGDLYASNIYSNGNKVLTTGDASVTEIKAGYGITVNTSSGIVTVTNAGVVTLSGSTYIGVSAASGTNVTLTNLGVQTLTAGTDTAVSSSTGTVTVWNTSTLQSVTDRGAKTTNVPTFTNGITVGSAAQQTSYTSAVTSTNATMSLDSFVATSYRTAKYVVQVVDTGYTPHLVQVEELLVFHDNNAGSTIPYIVKYGVGSNAGELGDWDAVYSGGNIVLKFTPNYTPTALTVKTARTAITA